MSKETLEKARLFLTQARQAAADGDSFRTKTNLEAAIVMGRTVTFHIQSEYSHRAGFDDWYNPLQTAMANDSLMQFMLNKRNYILKQGSVRVGRHVSLSTSIYGVSITGHVEIRVIRGKPWYRRNPKIIWEDFQLNMLRPIRRLLNHWRTRREIARKRAEAKKRAKVVVTDDNYYFADETWRHRPAFELVSEYLDKLEVIVADAEAHFGQNP